MAERYQIRPLGQWTDPVTSNRKSSGVFNTDWDSTLAALRDEVGKLDGQLPIVIQIDVQEIDLRQDGMLRTRANVGPFPGVVVSFQSKFGPLRYASDAYEQRWMGSLTGWQANVRAIALALEALRAVDRYGVSKRGEQYTGWKALPPSGELFANPQQAVRWMNDTLRDLGDYDTSRPKDQYRALAKRLHPDVAGDRDNWDRLEAAARLLEIR